MALALHAITTKKVFTQRTERVQGPAAMTKRFFCYSKGTAEWRNRPIQYCQYMYWMKRIFRSACIRDFFRTWTISEGH